MSAEQPPADEQPKKESGPLPPPVFDADAIPVVGGTGEKPPEPVVSDVGAPIEVSAAEKSGAPEAVAEPPLKPEKAPAGETKKRKERRPSAKKPAVSAPAPAPTPIAAPTPPATPPAPEAIPPQPFPPPTYEEMELTGTGWREEGGASETLLPARRGEGGVLAPLGGGEAPLHARHEIAAASPDNPDFLRYLEEVGRRGVFTGLGRADAPELLAQAFEHRQDTARMVIELYTRQLARDIGFPFGQEEIAALVSKYIEKLSLEQPERVVELHEELRRGEGLHGQIAGLEAQRSGLVSEAELQAARPALDEKKRVLELAKTSNAFWAGLKFWKGEGFGRLTWRKDLREARTKVRAAGYGTALGGVSAGSEPLGKFLRIEGKIDRELAAIESSLARLSGEGELRAAQERLNALKLDVIGLGAMQEEAAEVVRGGIRAAFEKMLHPEEPSTEAFEAADETLAKLEQVAASGDPAVLRMDYLRKMDPEAARASLRAGAEREAGKALRALFLETLENPRAPNRLAALTAVLEPWLRRGRIGGRKGALQVGVFIREQIRDFHAAEIAEKDAALKGLRELVASGLASREDAARLREEETALKLKDAAIRALLFQVSSVVSERERLARPPAPPPSRPKAPESTPSVSAPAPERIAAKPRRIIVPAAFAPATEEGPVPIIKGVRSERAVAPAPESLPALTFAQVTELPPELLGRVAREVSAFELADALAGEAEEVVGRVRAALTPLEQVSLDELLASPRPITGAVYARNMQKKVVEAARRVLTEDLKKETGTPPSPPPPSPETPPVTAPSRAEATAPPLSSAPSAEGASPAQVKKEEKEMPPPPPPSSPETPPSAPQVEPPLPSKKESVAAVKEAATPPAESPSLSLLNELLAIEFGLPREAFQLRYRIIKDIQERDKEKTGRSLSGLPSTEELPAYLSAMETYFTRTAETLPKLLESLHKEGKISEAQYGEYSRFIGLARRLGEMSRTPDADMSKFAEGDYLLWRFLQDFDEKDGAISVYTSLMDNVVKQLAESGIEP